MLLMKDEAFSEELEWRLIHYRDAYTSRQPQSSLEYRAVKNYLVPYVALDVTPMAGVNAHPQVPIAEVIVGPKPHPELAAASVQSLLRNDHAFATVRNSAIPLRA
jgi:hypothetical protein